MKPLSLSKVYRLIEPGPVVLLTTAMEGRANVMTLSWHMMVEFEPPRLACVVTWGDHSFAALRETAECVIAVPGVELAPLVVQIGNCSGRDVDKIATFGLETQAAERVAPPLLPQCFANLECRVVDATLAERFNLFVLEVVKAWTDPAVAETRIFHHHGCGEFSVDGERIRLESRMR
ncbi:flavin reductase [Aliidongia dinghuensis]|uniref:Flavin reductase n=1 Tax=Aliidongia dinghuensis TaxID=1867774 RepID=A0A8J2YYX5_9PROT|nr:flavin reductase family protein [Aliidongia dinghuensis]GGF43474.1 flavin reductase [Aliidongia dinghuensis]